jgi:hypothetical protein
MKKEKFVVYAHGLDCEGFASESLYYFESLEDAQYFANDCNAGSDGLKYEVMDTVTFENL